MIWNGIVATSKAKACGWTLMCDGFFPPPRFAAACNCPFYYSISTLLRLLILLSAEAQRIDIKERLHSSLPCHTRIAFLIF